MSMTPEQESHLSDVTDEITHRIDKKYRAGQAEHGGNLWLKPSEYLLRQAIDEAVDQSVYLITLYEQLYGSPRG